MQEAAGGGLTFEVVVEQLGEAARGVRAATDLARSGRFEALPQGLELGHDGLTRALFDFCGRWDRGVSLLVGDSTAMADALEQTAADYARHEHDAVARYGGGTRR